MKFTISTVLFVIAVTFGGGGYSAPIPELIVQLSAVVALGCWVFLVPAEDKAPDWPLVAAAGLFMAVPLLQVIPLPPILWHALPGRATEIEALRLIGQENSWRPISIAPYRTLSAMLAFLPFFALMFLVSQLSVQDRTRMLGVIVGIACLSALVGVLQLSSGDAHWLRFYSFTHADNATGFFASRNAAADLLSVGLLALAAFMLCREDLFWSLTRKLVAGAVGLFLLLSIFLSGSRAGIAISAVALLGSIGLHVRKSHFTRKRLIGAGAAGMILVVGALLLSSNPQLQRSWNRFSSFQDARPDLWEDTVFAANLYWPTGSGVGTFVRAFTPAERLEVVDVSRPGRAHNDYLEFLLEAGLLGILVAAALLAGLIFRVINILRNESGRLQRRQAQFAVGALGVVALHSIVDYPLRQMALAAVCAVALGMLGKVGVGKVAVEQRRESRSGYRRVPKKVRGVS